MGTENQNTPPLRLFYIMGTSRSGSTLLDVLLNTHPDIVGVGELAYLTHENWTETHKCCCGVKPAHECPFWSDVIARWFERTGLKARDEYRTMQRQVERFRHMLKMVQVRHNPPALFQDYVACTMELYRAIQDVSGKNILVESSKTPHRALMLALFSESNVQFIHTLRDARGYMLSTYRYKERTQSSKQTPSTSPRLLQQFLHSPLMWVLVNVLSNQVRAVVGEERACLVRYEDLIADPPHTLNRLGQFIGCNMQPVIAAIEEQKPLEAGHAFAGNRMRGSGHIQLRPDNEWMVRLSPRDRLICFVLAGWLMKQYGYGKEYATQ